jgi:hypothetical protein
VERKIASIAIDAKKKTQSPQVTTVLLQMISLKEQGGKGKGASVSNKLEVARTPQWIEQAGKGVSGNQGADQH